MGSERTKPHKEKVYDEQISPLVANIIKVCVENKISMLCAFELENRDGDVMCYTSSLIGPEYRSSAALAVATDIIAPEQDVLETARQAMACTGRVQ